MMNEAESSIGNWRPVAVPRRGIISAARYYYYLPIAFLRIFIFAVRQESHSLLDFKVLLFLARTPWLYLFDFKGKLRTPFGTMMIRNRDKMRSTAYGMFKTQFSFLKEMARIAPGRRSFPVVVDVGANVGDFTLAMANRCGKLIAIEPGFENFTSLESNIEANGIRNTTALKIAAHNTEETLRLQGMGSMLHVVDSGNGEVARGLPLDRVLNQLGAKHIDLLKIDVQGHEEKVLRGMRDLLSEKRLDMLVVEAHPNRGLRAADITSIMKTYGYKLVMNDNYLFHQP